MSCPMCRKNHDSTVDQALAALAATGRRLQRMAQKLSPKQASSRPAPGKWSAREIVCHLADCELVYGVRYRKILSEQDPALVAFDQDAWAALYEKQRLKDALAAFLTLRSGNLSLLKSVPKSEWDKSGLHPSYGKLTLRQLVLHLADHDKNHLANVGGPTAAG